MADTGKYGFILLVSSERRRLEIEDLEVNVLVELKNACNEISRLTDALAAPEAVESSASAL